MDREAWRVTVHGITKSDMIERLRTTFILATYKQAFLTPAPSLLNCNLLEERGILFYSHVTVDGV